MRCIAGKYFDGRSAAPQAAFLSIDAAAVVHVGELAQPIDIPLAKVTISDRLGNVTRRFVFPDGASFETDENDAVDDALAAIDRRQRSAVVHWLESRWPIALGSLAAIVVLSTLFIRIGIPWIADWGAKLMPPAVDRAIGAKGLDLLDRTIFKASTLAPARQAEVQALFARMTGDFAGDGHRYRLELRSGKSVGPNAFALPSGLVVVTDDLIRIAANDEEITAVLAHELGHVRARHALRLILESAGVSALAFALLGDVSSISGLVSAVPSLLTAKYSRDFERQADAYSTRWLQHEHIPAARLDSILCRIAAKTDGRDSKTLGFLATHPATSERAKCPARRGRSG